MNCRDDLLVVLERRRRFRRALKPEEQPAMDVLIAPVIEAVNGGLAVRPLIEPGVDIEPDRGRG